MRDCFSFFLGGKKSGGCFLFCSLLTLHSMSSSKAKQDSEQLGLSSSERIALDALCKKYNSPLYACLTSLFMKGLISYPEVFDIQYVKEILSLGKLAQADALTRDSQKLNETLQNFMAPALKLVFNYFVDVVNQKRSARALPELDVQDVCPVSSTNLSFQFWTCLRYRYLLSNFTHATRSVPIVEKQSVRLEQRRLFTALCITDYQRLETRSLLGHKASEDQDYFAQTKPKQKKRARSTALEEEGKELAF